MQAGHPHASGRANPDDDVHDGTELWNVLVRMKPQFRMVFCGSVSASDGTGYVPDRNIFGDEVHQMLFDPESRYRGGNGFLRLIEVLPGGRQAQVRTFSPYLEAQSMVPWITTPDSQFLIELDPVFADYAGWAAAMGLAGADADPAHDLDADGQSNLAEFAFVGNPQVADFPPLRLQIGDDGAARLEFPFRKQAAAFGLSYTIQRSTLLDGAGWEEFVPTNVVIGDEGDDHALIDPHSEWNTVLLDQANEAPKSFYRLIIEAAIGGG
jgi:hypothetical protein